MYPARNARMNCNGMKHTFTAKQGSTWYLQTLSPPKHCISWKFSLNNLDSCLFTTILDCQFFFGEHLLRSHNRILSHTYYIASPCLLNLFTSIPLFSCALILLLRATAPPGSAKFPDKRECSISRSLFPLPVIGPPLPALFPRIELNSALPGF